MKIKRIALALLLALAGLSMAADAAECFWGFTQAPAFASVTSATLLEARGVAVFSPAFLLATSPAIERRSGPETWMGSLYSRYLKGRIKLC
ncbi:MAG: hypothetical protein H8E75_00245 [Puniceicoccaceae bacterium]|nr:hypothetical protein [Puniceicoccaceae bacterium]